MNFLSYVESNSVRVPFSGCSIWTGATTNGGYARSIVANRLHGTTIVHKAVFQEIHGSVPQGMYVCHHCDTPSCVNPDHLFLGTPSDNAQDRKIKGRSAPKIGDMNGRSILNSAQVLEIRALLAQGKRQVDLAKIYGVSQSSISHIKLGYTWGNEN